ncbi:uncharacterized protein [Paramormyrops kingsleyae]|uniref:Uncharacterized protein n=1 Tax=Paramormyrops kingsleyae TaxID=1676925 RepID=A0A3B3S6K6_9TELE
MADERDLERQAVEELLQEAGRGRVRAQTMGPAGWMRCPLRGANKRFLLNTLRTISRPGRSLRPRHSDQSGIQIQEVEQKSKSLQSGEAQHSRSRGRSPSGQHSRGHSRSPVKGSNCSLKSSSPTPKPLDSTKPRYSHPKSRPQGCTDLQE